MLLRPMHVKRVSAELAMRGVLGTSFQEKTLASSTTPFVACESGQSYAWNVQRMHRWRNKNDIVESETDGSRGLQRLYTRVPLPDARAVPCAASPWC